MRSKTDRITTLKLLKRKAEKLGRFPTAREINKDPKLPNYTTLRKHFGSLPLLAKKVGFSIKKKRRYDPDIILRLLEKKARKLKRFPTSTEIERDSNLPCYEWVQKHIGSIFDLAQKTGFPTKRRKIPRRYKPEEVLRLLRKKAKELGRFPIAEEIDKDPNLPGHKLINRFFGSLPKLAKNMGLPRKKIKKKRKYKPQEVLKLLKIKVRKLGRMITAEEIDRDPHLPNHKIIDEYFGSMRKLAKRLGYTRNIQPRYTDGELLKLLKLKAKEIKRTPTGMDMVRDKRMPSPQTYRKHFGSFHNAVRLIGYEPKFVRHSLEELEEVVIKFFRKHKRPPTLGRHERYPLPRGLNTGILKRLGITWHQLLTRCNLPILSTNPRGRLIRKAEFAVMDRLRRYGFKVRDMRIERYHSPYDILVNGKIRLHVSGSNVKRTKKRLIWGFGVPKVKRFDFMIGVGIDELDKVRDFFLFPKKVLKVKILHIPIYEKNKWSSYYVPNIGKALKELIS